MPKRKRQATIKRITKETRISLKISLDGCGTTNVDTGIPFLNHMLVSLAKHGLFDLAVKAKGDLEVDIHHTNEDVGIVLGEAVFKALGLKRGIQRFGFSSIPMDEALLRVSLDLSGRPSFLVIKSRGVKFSRLDTYSFHDATEFLRACAISLKANLAVEVVSGEDSHHIIEAMFKGFAKALDQATIVDRRVKGIPSTKGSL
jgi:imidazoleglycerol-phosphate dehydratase